MYTSISYGMKMYTLTPYIFYTCVSCQSVHTIASVSQLWNIYHQQIKLLKCSVPIDLCYY